MENYGLSTMELVRCWEGISFSFEWNLIRLKLFVYCTVQITIIDGLPFVRQSTDCFIILLHLFSTTFREQNDMVDALDGKSWLYVSHWASSLCFVWYWTRNNRCCFCSFNKSLVSNHEPSQKKKKKKSASSFRFGLGIYRKF